MELSKNNNIKNFFPHSVTGKIDDSFIGIKFIKNNIHFYYPESYDFDLTSKDCRKDILDLLNTISIAKTASLENEKAYNTQTYDGEFAILSYLWIIRDYLTNGFYVNKEKIYKRNQKGKVNWKRTISSQPIVSNGNIIYSDIVVETKNELDNVLVEIHKYCVKKSIDFIGWLFNLESKFIKTKPFNSSIKKKYITVLNDELNHTFDDYKKNRLLHMRNVLTGLDESNKDENFVYGVDSYYYIFERMIDSIFGNVKNIKEFNPKAGWYLKQNDFRKISSSELRLDTILLKDNDAFIIDSKFYRFGFTGDVNDLPETTSIQKQITYGEYVRLIKTKYDNVYNAFLLPYNKNKDIFKLEDNLQYIGFAKAEWNNNEESHQFIHTFLIDLKHVVKVWNKYNHSQDVEQLVKEILENDKKYCHFE